MESEEAIMENENNSNVESESNTRDQQVPSKEGPAEDSVESRPVEGEIPSISDVKHSAHHSFGTTLIDSDSTQWIDAVGSTSAKQMETSTSPEQRQSDCAETVTASVRSETSLQDYEDFVGEENISHSDAHQPGDREAKESVSHGPASISETAHSERMPEIAAESVEQRSWEGSKPAEAVCKSQVMSADDVSTMVPKSVDDERKESADIGSAYEQSITTSVLQQEGSSGVPGTEGQTMWEDDIDLLGDDSHDLQDQENLAEEGFSRDLETKCDDAGEESSTVCDVDGVPAESKMESQDGTGCDRSDAMENSRVDDKHSTEVGSTQTNPWSDLAHCESAEQGDGVGKLDSKTVSVEEIVDTVVSEGESVSEIEKDVERASGNVDAKATSIDFKPPDSEASDDRNITAVEISEGKEQEEAVGAVENNECQVICETQESNSSATAQDELRLHEQLHEKEKSEGASEMMEVEELQVIEHSAQNFCKEGPEEEFTGGDEELNVTKDSEKQTVANEAETKTSAKASDEETLEKNSEILTEASLFSQSNISAEQRDTTDQSAEMKMVTDSATSNVATIQQMNVEDESVHRTFEEEDMDVTSAEIINTKRSEPRETDMNAEDVQNHVVEPTPSETDTPRPESNAEDMIAEDVQKSIVEPISLATNTERPESNADDMIAGDVQKSAVEPIPSDSKTQGPGSTEEAMTKECTQNSVVKLTPSETSTERQESNAVNDAAEDTLNSTMELPSSDTTMPPVMATNPRDSVNETESSSNQNKAEETTGSPAESAGKTDSASESASAAETKSAEVASSQATVSNETQDSENDDDVIEITPIKKELSGVERTDTVTQATEEAKSEVLSTDDIKQEHLGLDKSGNAEEEVVILDDEGEVVPVKEETGECKTMENGLGIQISAVSGNQQHLHANAEHSPSTPTTTTITTAPNHKSESPKSKSSKSKVQTCIVCSKTCKCKYNIVRNGDIRHLCDDTCFKKFRKSPSSYLKGKEDAKTQSKDSPAVREALTSNKISSGPKQDGQFKTCAVCQLMNVNTQQSFCNWKGLDFCGESCLGKFLGNLNTSCSFCHAYIPIDMRATFCLKIGNDMRPFCKQRCYNEFKKKLRLCAFCQRDIAGVPTAFTAMVGTDGKFREFCSQPCLKKMETQVNDVEVLSVGKGNLKQETITCSVCEKQGAMKHTVIFQGKVNKLCGDPCMSAFQYSNKIDMNKCDSCGTICTAEEAQAHFVQFEGLLKRFCSDQCVNQFRKNNSKVVPCAWCATKKLNFDMIERLDAENKYQMFCSLNCLSLYRVNLQAKSNQAVSCDQCKKVVPAQYHLTMSDASVRNFCCYTCVMTFQSQFTKHTAPAFGSPTPSTLSQPGQVPSQSQSPVVTNIPQKGPGSKGRARKSTRQASAKDQQPSTFPVITNVMSLAPQAGEQALTPGPVQASVLPPGPPGMNSNMAPSGDGKHQILIQAAAPKAGKNKSLQCRPLTQTKATSCRPHSQSKEIQTDEVPAKTICVPVPVPIYIPMPCVMYTAPTPTLVPFPVPIPVPIFIPTTRKSANGISKAIKEIVERMPSDPLEAELLMMAEAVASDKGPGDSDTDSEAEAGGDDFAVPDEEAMRPAAREDENLMMRKREGQGEEDMIQMALRMAEEMSGPIEDLESSVEPVAVNTEPPRQQQQAMQYDTQVDDEYIPPRSGRGRGAKRASRGRPQASRAKRPRTDTTYTEDDSAQSEPAAAPQSMEPPPDANYRLKFTYGVNAWRHWVINKNAQLEKSKQSTGSFRVRLFPTDILKCTTDELNFTLCMFIKDVRKPNGEEYSPDSIFYLCLGIQQYLYENGRIDNIFTDMYFEKFTDCLHEVLKTHQPKVNPQGQMLCRIEEEHLWESKQLGAHSPYVLLNTLIYFHTKHFILKTAQEHMSLSFAQILKHWKKGMPVKGQSASSGKNVSLRFYCLANGKKDGLAARKNKEGVPVYEVTENFDNPLRCPVKLYEFFLSKCPESIKNRNDIFYPVPERSCVPDSPVWYSTQSIDIHTMDKMLTRVLLVREIQEAHLHAQPIYL